VYTDDVNILGRSIPTIKKNTETLVIVSTEIGLEVNYEKPQDTVISQDQTAVQHHNIKIYNRFFERVE
jgi:adenosyl cobinamide kinase/adenosyl cobinamide phosphate guanylyltransferase